MSADPRHPLRDERCELAALLERAYRLALWLHDAERVDRVDLADRSGGDRAGGDAASSRLDAQEEPGASPAAFAVHVASSELVDVLDEARARLVAGAGAAIAPSLLPAISPAGTPTPVRSSAPPDR